MRASSAALVLLVTLLNQPAAAQDPLAEARALYAAAAYEDALSLLNRLRTTTVTRDQSRAIEQYRAFCLLALGRTADAAQAIAALVAVDPTYMPPAGEVSPRLITAFTDVRKRMLPDIITERYTAAKAAYDRKQYAEAAAGFTAVIDVLSAPSVAQIAAEPPLSDLRTLAEGFRGLSIAAAVPPPPLPPPTAVAPLPDVEPVVVGPPPPPPVYGPEHPNVVPPIVVRQFLPPYPSNTPGPKIGAIQVIIDESGAVEQASMLQPTTVTYDRLALQAARQWQYRPATLDGRPVKYRKTIQIEIRR